MNATNVVERVRVAGGGRQIASQVGTHLVGGVAEFLGLPLALSEAMTSTVQRRSKHDRGRLLTQAALTLAAGGRCVSDVAVLRNQPWLFGEVASDATVWRTFDAIDAPTLDRLRDARSAATGRLLAQLDDHGPVVIDVDASLFEVHSEQKEGATPQFFDEDASHQCRDVLDRWYSSNPDALREAMRERPDGPREVSYVEHRADPPIHRRYDLIMASSTIEVLDVRYRYHDAIEAGSDHGLVEATISF